MLLTSTTDIGGTAGLIEKYGVNFFTSALFVFTVAVILGIVAGKIRFDREVAALQKQLDAANSLLQIQQESDSNKIKAELQEVKEELSELKQIKELVERLTSQMEGVRDDLREVKVRGGGRSA